MKFNVTQQFQIDDQSNDMHYDALFGVYQRILGASTIGVYGYLKQCPKHQTFTHESILLALNLQVTQVQLALMHLQQFELIRIFKKDERFVYQLKNPLSISAFLGHDVFGRIALKHLGSKDYEALRQQVQETRLVLEDYEELSFPIDKSFMHKWDEHHEAYFTKSIQSQAVAHLSFDIKSFLMQCSEVLLPMKKRTPETIEAIKEIGSVYGLSVKTMKSLVGKAHVENDLKFNVEELRRLAAKEDKTVMPEVSHPYELPPVLFLKQLRNYIEPSKLEKYVIQDLLSTYRLSPQVINVLIDANYKHNQQTLHLRQLETIGMQWASLNIQSVEEAQVQVPKSYRNSRKRRVENMNQLDVLPSKDSLSLDEAEAIKEAFRKVGDQ